MQTVTGGINYIFSVAESRNVSNCGDCRSKLSPETEIVYVVTVSQKAVIFIVKMYNFHHSLDLREACRMKVY
jgi:hypothetical protein